jgi:8-amino-7-oxononanoate synthase
MPMGSACIGKPGAARWTFSLDADDVPILMGTLGKAFGTFGAFVAGSER